MKWGFRLKLISACLISWCESKTIDLCLKSLVGLVDEVIIADTGSFDGTVKIAREWINRLNLSGEVLNVRTRTLGQARMASWEKCRGDWILLIDSNLVLSNTLKKKLKEVTKSPNLTGIVRSLNLTGDYSHYFVNRPFMAHHNTLFNKAKTHWINDRDRPRSRGTKRSFIGTWAVNLSRVRPAWRYYYRGEQFDPRAYKKKRWNNELNLQYQWTSKGKYYSLIEYMEAEKGLTLEEVKKIAPKWYLDQLQKYAKPLEPNLLINLPEVLKKERKNPRYRLIKKAGKIVGRWPEL